MYTEFFGLSENPFAITPDPRYLFMSGRHQDALAHLLYGLKEGGGFVQLTGEVGTGKTTLIRALLEQLPENVDVALIFNPRLTAFEFLATACDELHVEYPSDTTSIKVLIDAVNKYLLQAHANGRRVVMIVDEAQQFQTEVLEQIRLLTNLETTKQKLLQIILVGQPELREMLGRPDLRQLAQRITARYHLVPMAYVETTAYIRHRITIAGAQTQPFTNGAMKRIWRFSGGVPRLVNIVCDRALLGAYARDKRQINTSMINEAITELGFAVPKRGRLTGWMMGGAVAASLALSVTAWVHTYPDGNVFDLAVAPKNQADSELSHVGSEPKIDANGNADTESDPVTNLDVAASSTVSIDTAGDVVESDPGAMTVPESVHVTREVSEADGTTAAITAMTAISTADELTDLLFTDNSTADLENAFTALFAQWKLNYARLVGVTGCERAIGARLNCHWASGSWNEFVRLNRPALVWLENPQTKAKHYVVIKQIHAQQGVLLSVGDKSVWIDPEIMSEWWSGQYLVLWRPPALDVRLIKPGDRGELVVWLRRNLERVDGRKTVASRPELFDTDLQQRVLAFQQANALDADGLVGEQTLIHLTTLTDEDVPLLSSDR